MTRNFNPTCNYEYGKIMADDRYVENFNEGLGFLLQLLNPLDKEMDGLPDAVVDSGIEEVVSKKMMEKTHLKPIHKNYIYNTYRSLKSEINWSVILIT